MDSHDKYKSTLGFTDLLFNVLLGFAFLFFVAFILINPVAKRADVVVHAEYLITMTWPDNDPSDFDLWVRDPQHRHIGFRNMDQGLINLDRDDLGLRNDTVIIDGKQHSVPLNKETVTIRGIIPGEYLVTVHLYMKLDDRENIPVTVEVVRLNPYQVIYSQTQRFSHYGQEQNYYKFVIQEDGSVTGIATSLETAVNRWGP